MNSKTNRSVTFSYRTYPFEGKSIGVIKIAEQERPIYLRKRFGKLDKEVVFYRQGTTTAVATPDEIKKMAASGDGKRPPTTVVEEQVRVRLSVDFSSGLQADLYNSGQVPLYIKQVSLVSETRDESKAIPFQLTTTNVPMLPTISLPNSAGGSQSHVFLGPQQVDIESRREVRFILPKTPSAFLRNLIAPPKTIWVSVETFDREIRRESCDSVMPLLKSFVEARKAQEEAAKPKNVSFFTGDGILVPEGQVEIRRGDHNRTSAGVKGLVEGFAISKVEVEELITAVAAGKICGRIGKYQWRLD